MNIFHSITCKRISKGMLLFLLSLFACSGNTDVEYPFSDVELQAGDLVFRKGKGTKSRAVLFADKSGLYSHVGIVSPTDSGMKIVHIEPNDSGDEIIKVEDIACFFNTKNAEAGAVMRFSDTVGCMEKAAEYAMTLYVNRQIKFDHDYNLEDTTKMYCSELVWHVYDRVGYDVSDNRRNTIDNFPSFSGTYIFPSDIYKNSKLSIIYKF